MKNDVRVTDLFSWFPVLTVTVGDAVDVPPNLNNKRGTVCGFPSSRDYNTKTNICMGHSTHNYYYNQI